MIEWTFLTEIINLYNELKSEREKIRQLNNDLGKKYNLETTETRGTETEEEEITAKKSGPADPAELQKRMSDAEDYLNEINWGENEDDKKAWESFKGGYYEIIGIFNQETENVNNQIIGLKKDISNLNDTVEKLEVQLTEKDTKIEGLERDKKGLQNKLDTADNENKILTKEKTDLQTEINDKTEKITELEKGKNDLKTERDANAELAVKHAGVLLRYSN